MGPFATCSALAVATVLLLPIGAWAQPHWTEKDEHVRYMAMGDSLAAGRGALPQTEGYVYRLYRSGVFGPIGKLFLSNAGVGDATTGNVRFHQVPQATGFAEDGTVLGLGFRPDVVTILAGGNDLLLLLGGVGDPAQIAANLAAILGTLRAALPETCLYIGNQYHIPEIEADPVIGPAVRAAIDGLNTAIATVAGSLDVPVADVEGAFAGRTGLLLVERRDAGRFLADPFEVHPTNAGHKAIAEAFERVIREHPERERCNLGVRS